jgi:tRNA (guanine37-N1)-methyltransferase
MRLDVITIFPGMFQGPFTESIMKRAQEKGKVEINLIDVREFTTDRHRTVDEKPYGGGAGMLMKVEPLFAAVESCRTERSHVVLLTPQGTPFKQSRAIEMATLDHVIFVCGHYEGVDERVRLALIDEEISIGDYVLTNGNLAAMVVADSIVRLIPGVLGCEHSTVEESFSSPMLEYPQYTRPETYRDMTVPKVLLSGNHQAIDAWRCEQALERTASRRPDLLKD